MSAHLGSRLRTVVLSALVVTLSVSVPALAGIATPVAVRVDLSTTNEAQYFVSVINAERTARGIAPLVIDVSLEDAAEAWSDHLAASGATSPAHSPTLRNVPGNWQKLGENVGVATGAGLEALEAAFVSSPGHFRNMMDPAYDLVGIGVSVRGNTVYVTERFGDTTVAPVARTRVRSRR